MSLKSANCSYSKLTKYFHTNICPSYDVIVFCIDVETTLVLFSINLFKFMMCHGFGRNI